MNELFIDFDQIDLGTIVIEDIDTLNEFLKYHRQLSSDNSIWLQNMNSSELRDAQKILASYLGISKGSLRIFIREPVIRELLSAVNNVHKDFKTYPELLEDSIISKHNSSNIRIKLKELFRNLHNA